MEHIVGTFHVRLVEVSLGSFGALWHSYVRCKDFQNATPPPGLNWLQQNCMRIWHTMQEYRLLHFLAICQLSKILLDFEIFLNTGPYGSANNSKRLTPPPVLNWLQQNFMRILITMQEYKLLHFLTVFIQFQSNLVTNILVMGEYRLLHFLSICQLLNILWHFEVVTWQSMGSPKMWNISRTFNHRAKQTKI